MQDLLGIDHINIEGRNVLVRGDLDVSDLDNPRIESVRNIIRFLQDKDAQKIKVIGHRETDFPVCEELKKEFPDVEFDDRLRNYPGEKENSLEFAKKLAEGWDVYVNESFAVSHRGHASFVNLPKAIKENGGSVCLGSRFLAEIKNLNRVLDNPKKPVMVVISGIKEDKLSYIKYFLDFCDKVLVGGRLPEFLEKNHNAYEFDMTSEKLFVANLLPDKEDITVHSIEKFENVLKTAGTIVVSGPLGKFEDEGHHLGTERVFGAVVNNKNAFKVAGGGDTEEAIKLLNLENEFDWISVGGGSMLEFLARRSLPGIDALID